MPTNKINALNHKYTYAVLFLIVALSIPFGIYSAKLGGVGFTKGLLENTHLNGNGGIVSNHGLSLHLLLGAMLTILAPVQVILGWSNKGMKWHKWIGYIVIIAALCTGIGGLTYTLVHGTVGGMVMNIGFGMYGSLVILSAIKAGQYARRKQMKLHKEWSMRLFILAIGSWLYRLCYGLLIKHYSDELAFKVDFRSPVDYFMDFAFFIPPLIGLEIYFRWNTNRADRFHPLLVSFFLLLLTFFFIYGFYIFFVVFD